MANLIIKPTDGGSLILQDEGGTAAHTIDASGNHTLSGTTNNIGTVTAGTLGSAVNLNNDVKKNSWYRFATSSVNVTSSAVIDFGGSGFIGSNITESSGRMTCTVAGLYLINVNMSQFQKGNTNLDVYIRKNASIVNGTGIYALTANDGTQYNGEALSCIVECAANDIIDVYGKGYYYGTTGASMTAFSGTRLGSSS